MLTATAVQEHIACEVIADSNHQVVVIEFVSQDITRPAHARELGEQLNSLIWLAPRQYFVIDCAGVRSLASTALSEILSFVHRAQPVWLCNLDHALWTEAYQIGLYNWTRSAANRSAAIADAERAARWDEEDRVDDSAWANYNRHGFH